MSRLDLISGRTRLENLLEQTGSDQKELELSVYDLLLMSRLEYSNNVEQELKELIKKARDYNPEDESLTLETESSFLLWLEKYGHAPAYIIALNFDPKIHDSHRFRGEEDITFNDKPFTSEKLKPLLKELGYKDGAILIDSQGNISAVRAQLTNVDPKSIYQKDKKINLNDPQVYGFRELVNVRHFAALGASFHLKGVISYTLSETSGNIRRYREGKITFSTLREEDPYPEHETI